jgi:hypothetical protein
MWTSAQIRKVAGETLLQERTIGRYLRGEKVRDASVQAIEDAARRLGIELPAKAVKP